VPSLDPGTAAFVRVKNTSNDGDLVGLGGRQREAGGLTNGSGSVEPDDDNTLLYATEQRAPETM